ncbi:S8 family peptidase [Brevibacillus gelatini]
MDEKKGKEPKPHFWIPDTEVEAVDYDPTSRPTPLDINHSEHGYTLSQGINSVARHHAKNKTPISDDVIIFKMELRDGEKIDARGDYEKIFLNNRIKVNSIRESNVAVVSATPRDFGNLTAKLQEYIKRDGRSYDFFQYVKSISELNHVEKQTQELIEVKKQDNEKIDLQIVLVPNLSEEIYDKIRDYLVKLISDLEGELLDEPFILTDNTPIYRVLLPSTGVDALSDQEIVLQIGKTPFFGTKNKGGGIKKIDISDVEFQFDRDPRELPIVCVLDDGIQLPDRMKDCIAGRYVSPDINTTTTCNHGTKVASRAIFGDHIDLQVRDKLLVPRVRVIDAVISDGVNPIPETTLIRRIREAVLAIKDQTKIFCLSFNERKPISGYSVSSIAYELDMLMREHGVLFVVPVGNHDLWTYHNSIDDIADDDLARIASPGESYYGLTIGAYSRDDHQESISQKNQISPFSRVGFGFAGIHKPDLVYPGGNVFIRNSSRFIAADSAAYVIDNTGHMTVEYGTSFAAPIAAADIALLTQTVPENDIRIAKALIIHHAEPVHPLMETLTFEERELLSRLYGKGRGSFENAKDSFRNRATYIRSGTMSRLEKQRVKFHMPSTMAAHSNRKVAVARVSVTCICFPPVSRNMGYEYLRAYVDTSLHRINSNDRLVTDNPEGKEGRYQWHHLHHFSQVFSSFNPGDWQIWLQLYTKPELQNDEEVEYVLVVTIEDLTSADVDVHGGILLETQQRFQYLTEVQVENREEDDE